MLQEILLCLLKIKIYTVSHYREKFEDFRTAPFMEKNALFFISQESAFLIPENQLSLHLLPVLQDLLGYPRSKWPFP